MTEATSSGGPWKCARNSTRVNATNSTKTIVTMGAMWMRKSLKLSPARLPMMMFGGSPIRVAAPPMLAARISAMRKGCGAIRNRVHTTIVTGTTSMIVVTLSRNGDAIAVISISMTISRNGSPRARFADQIAR